MAGLEDEIRVIPTGSLGFSDKDQVAIAIYPDNIIYCPVLVSTVQEIVKEHFLKGRVVKTCWLIPWSKKEVTMEERTSEHQMNLDVQKRVLLKNVGKIDLRIFKNTLLLMDMLLLKKLFSK